VWRECGLDERRETSVRPLTQHTHHTQVVGAIFRMNVDGITPGADYLAARPEVLAELLEG
jgi:hypothetical protein